MAGTPSPIKKKHGKLLSKQAEGRAIRDTCLASAIDQVSTFARCEVKTQEQCRFTLKFPNAKLCLHPLVQKIVERTKRKKLK